MSSLLATAAVVLSAMALFPSFLQPIEAVTNIKVQNVTLQHQQNVMTAVPVVFSVTYPTDEPAKRMPLLMLFNGASVESYWYRRVIRQLASKGYVVITSDYYRPYTVPIPNLPKPGCRKDAVVIPSAKLINTLYNYISSEKPDFMQKADTDELVLLSHSLGGFIAFKTLAGLCKLDPLSLDPTCEGYSPVRNSKGKDVLIGNIAWEGFLSNTPFPPLILPDGAFALYLSGEYNTKGMTTALKATRGCASYVALNNASHYGMNDYVAPSSTHQVAPCAAPAITDDKGFTTDRATQEAGVDLAAGIIDGVLRARNPATHEAAKRDLDALTSQERVLEGARLDLDCLLHGGKLATQPAPAVEEAGQCGAAIAASKDSSPL